MMTKVWNDTSWSDRDSAYCIGDGRRRVENAGNHGRQTHASRSEKRLLFSLSLSLWISTSPPRVDNADSNGFLRYITVNDHRSPASRLSVYAAVGTQYCCFYNIIKIIIVVNAGHEYFTTIRVHIITY